MMDGHAGYAPGPTGNLTNLAMVGAYVLAGEICKHKGDLSSALRVYEETMHPLINNLQKIPSLIPDLLEPQRAWALWLRNTIFALICCQLLLHAMQGSGSPSATFVIVRP